MTIRPGVALHPDGSGRGQHWSGAGLGHPHPQHSWPSAPGQVVFTILFLAELIETSPPICCHQVQKGGHISTVQPKQKSRLLSSPAQRPAYADSLTLGCGRVQVEAPDEAAAAAELQALGLSSPTSAAVGPAMANGHPQTLPPL